MPEPAKITILLADEDALRRDGLAAVLSGAESFDVVAGVPDGQTALQEIRDLRPDVAIIDLNLPMLHGIELVRRIRSEALGTKVIILAGTADDEIVREVVRAGGDGYLLKNGPARHLIDAISYVRDGGQYFSPQLRRDGRDRHLLQEPPRPIQDWAGSDRRSRERDFEDDTDEEYEGEPPVRSATAPRGRKPARRSSDPAHLRERLREESAGPDLEDRDYEIMSMMADGIRPILDRLDEIDNRVAQMEDGDAPVPSDPRAWLSTQLADTLREPRGGDVAILGRSVNDLEARLPELIEETVARRFQQMAGKLQEEIEETHVRTLESFVKNIQVKLVQRVSALEQDMTKQSDAMHQLREYSQRTEDNLSRLITGVDKLAQELPRRLAAAAAEVPPPDAEIPPQAPRPHAPGRRRSGQGRRSMKILWMAICGAIVIALVVWGVGRFRTTRPPIPQGLASGAAEPAKPVPPSAGADTKTKMQAAQEYTDRKDYAMAEDLYKQVIKSEPNNADALKALASVLYREDKIDESTAIMDRIPK